MGRRRVKQEPRLDQVEDLAYDVDAHPHPQTLERVVDLSTLKRVPDLILRVVRLSFIGRRAAG